MRLNTPDGIFFNALDKGRQRRLQESRQGASASPDNSADDLYKLLEIAAGFRPRVVTLIQNTDAVIVLLDSAGNFTCHPHSTEFYPVPESPLPFDTSITVDQRRANGQITELLASVVTVSSTEQHS